MTRTMIFNGVAMSIGKVDSVGGVQFHHKRSLVCSSSKIENVVERLIFSTNSISFSTVF